METDKQAPGWYPAPEMADTQRYWDGMQWTGQVAPATRDEPANGVDRTAGLVIIGWVLAILFPIGGLAIGIYLLAKGKGSAAMALSLASLFSMLCWGMALAGG